MYNAFRSLRSLNFLPSGGGAVSLKKLHLHTHLFDETRQRDLRSLNSLLASYVRDDNVLAAWAFFRRMHCAGSDLDAYTFTPVLGACSKLPGQERGKQVHALMIKTGSESGAVSKTALMDMYSKYGCLGDSIKVFDEMGSRDVVTWNRLLSGFLRHGLGKEALGVFEAMRRERVEFTEVTLCSVLKACAFLKALRQGRQVHGLVVVIGRDLVVLGTALIDLYASVGCMEEAMKVFSSLGSRKDDVMRNSLISGCVLNRKYELAFSIMCMMKPNVVALTSALAACAENSDLWSGKQIHCGAIRQDFLHDTQLCNAMLDMYAKCGKIFSARSLFDGIRCKSVVSWTSMIDAYGRHGHGLEALELFKMMEEEGGGVLPNSVTFFTLLSACGHAGLVDQGRECFHSAREKYGLELSVEHYACLIDILGQAGLIEEAWSLYRDMVKHGPMPTAAVWAALLHACTHNMDVARGDFAATQLLHLEPNKPGNYVLVSNFYTAIGRWDSVNELRNFLNTKGLAKEAERSWFNVTGSHENAMVVSV